MKKILLKIWPALAIAAVWLIFSSPYFVKGLVPFPSRYLATFFPPWSAEYGMPVKNNAMPDVITQIYPWKKISMATWKQGEVPLWNPYSFSGTPQLGNYQSAVLSPFNLLFFILPMVHAWSILVLLQPLLAGLLMYLFLREINISKEGSLLGSFAFMFCGFITVWMAYATLAYAALWLPLILWGIHRYLRNPSPKPLLAVSLGLVMSFFSGHFQISFYAAGASLVYLFFETLTSKKYRSGFWLFIFYLLGILLSLPQLLPAASSYLSSVRSGLFGRGGEVIPWQYFVTIFAPDFFGNPVTRNDWFGHYAEWASFIGVVPLTLAIYSIFRKKTGEQWLFIIMAFGSLLLATPTPFSKLLFELKFPAISTSAASRIIIILSFSVATLSAFGLDGLREDWEKRKKKSLVALTILSFILVSVLWILVWFGKVMPDQWLIVAKRNLVLPTIILFAGLALMFSGFFLKNRKLTKLIVISLVLITAFEMLRYSTKWMPFDPQNLVYPDTGVGKFLRENAGNNRVFGNIFNEFTGINFLQGIIGYDAVYQTRYGEYISTAVDGKIRVPERSVVNLAKDGKYAEKILEFLGVKYLVHRLSDGRFGWAYPYWNFPFYKSVYKDNYYEIFENQEVMPRTILASSYKIIIDNQKIIDQMFSADFNLKDTLVLETKPVEEPESGSGSAEITKYQPNYVNISVQTSVPKLLFLSDTYDSGWQAKIDGKVSPLYRADYDFRAVSVPAGNHNVEFIYNPMAFRLGLAAAALAGIIITAVIFLKFVL